MSELIGRCGRSPRLSRAERARRTYQKLMQAAADVVGEEGYTAASIAKITARAGVAHGTFYSYFDDRQQLFDVLLPFVGRQLTDQITQDVINAGVGLDREVARFRSYCDYLSRNPGFYRILYEAEVFAPKAHATHMNRLVDGYRRAMKRAMVQGTIIGYDEAELDAIIWILLGARAYVAMCFIARAGGAKVVPDSAIRAYARLCRGGLFSGAKVAAKTRKAVPR